MKLDIDTVEPRLQALRVQLVDVDDGVLVKRGRVEFRVSGARAAQVLQLLLVTAVGGATRTELCAPFAGPDRAAVDRLIGELERRRILVPPEEAPGAATDSPETENDLFVWHFGETVDSLADRLVARRITIMGVNAVSHRIATALIDGSVPGVEVVDYPLLANLRMFDDRGALDTTRWTAGITPVPYDRWRPDDDPDRPVTLIATTDFGGLRMLRWWNEQAVAHNWHFLPVALRDLIGYVGPFVVPGETACYECLRARQNSHLADPPLHRATEEHAFEGQAATGFHPAMASILGDIAALEMVKFYGGWPGPRLVGSLVEVNLLATTMASRRVLRIPRCAVCGNRGRRSGISLTRQSFLPGHEVYA
ncbi:TOMM precursor leader peptide-binding protein [Pseudonocardia tropica]|uniref:TOMM leader peptide-binding protein n=1 Tax=Pseudonocardia tropica TaxID=681289 RepID=A0ABV1K260_9PSEU